MRPLATSVRTDRAFSPDEPVDTRKEDAFAHASYARVLADTLAHAPSPFTVGLFGPWGVGKSTIIGGIEQTLGQDAVLVEIDVWRYEGDALRRELLRTLATSLADQRQLHRRFKPARELQDLSVDVQTSRLRVSFSKARLLQLVLVCSALCGIVIGALAVHPVREALSDPKQSDARILTAVSAIALFAVGLVRAFLEPVAVQQTVRRVEDPERFVEKFRSLLQAIKPRRLVIAMDNLDRCSPDRALETLNIIKTFLEPTARDARADDAAEVTFLIAVDDEALRRHLLAQEASGGATGLAAATYVDEYLRKFFNVTIRVQQVIAEDLRDYTTKALDGFRTRRKVDDEAFQRLVSIVHAALRQNPRRIKQFVNNLELRLRLMEDREPGPADREPMIAQRLSGEIAMVAKVTILEEEWPAHYRLLVARPGRLREWTTAALDRLPAHFGDATWGPANVLIEREWPDLTNFLVATSDVDSPQLAAFLSMKQSDLERRLPGFGEFREAAISGALDAALTLLQDHPDHVAGYGAELRSIFHEEATTGSLVSARTVLEVALTADELGGDRQSHVDQVLAEVARQHPFVDQELLNLPAETLVAGLQRTTPTIRAELLDQVLNRLPGAVDERQRHTAARLVSSFVAELEAAQRGRLREQLGASPLSDDFEILGAFADQDATLLPPVILDVASNRLSQQLSLLAQPGAGLFTAVVIAALGNDPPADPQERLVQALAAHLRNAVSGRESMLAPALRMLAAAPAAPALAVDELLSVAGSFVDSVAEADLRALLDACRARAEIGDELNAAVPAVVLAVAASSMGLLLGWIDERLAELANGPLADALVTHAVAHEKELLHLRSVIVALEPELAAQRSEQMTTAFLVNQRFDVARILLEEAPRDGDPDRAAAQAAMLVETIVAAAAGQTGLPRTETLALLELLRGPAIGGALLSVENRLSAAFTDDLSPTSDGALVGARAALLDDLGAPDTFRGALISRIAPDLDRRDLDLLVRLLRWAPRLPDEGADAVERAIIDRYVNSPGDQALIRTILLHEDLGRTGELLRRHLQIAPPPDSPQQT